MSDPVASKSAFLCMYMKSHPDTIVAYVKYFGKVAGNVVTAEMKSIDSQGMNLSYKLTNGDASSVHVKFDPPLASYDQVKPRLLAMKADAQEGLGMLKTPVITSFRFPFSKLVSTYWGIGALCVALPYLPTSISSIVSTPAMTLVSAMGFQQSVQGAIQTGAVIHVLEGLYTWYLCRRYVKSKLLTAEYVAATILLGMPIWSDLKKRVQEMRIESVMKAE
ncbi:hypothetical protein PAXRUDRAFT_832136 [Paxillus rubicundulus Ve08.2h10]|uniref:DUF2470 domain-containing protein n=1 Tax=Paxillus rubicundulus Ve08.2h10 TaxID=930991 RepID=A0A0D0DS87_9AGAM|nr:hypothetical protein PAXRUDRAFT_832136 [Paxillus rubicundulus Ve08.2h10]